MHAAFLIPYDDVVSCGVPFFTGVWYSFKGFAGTSLGDVLDVKVSCLPHHSFDNDKYLVEVGRLKSSVMEGGGETPAAEVARLLQHVNPALVYLL